MNETRKTAEKYAKLIFDKYIELSEPSRASGELQNSATWRVEETATTYNIIFNLEDYYYYVEVGRKAGSFPNLDAIKRWIDQKPILPRPYVLKSGKQVLPTKNQIAFLIGRKIQDEGIEGKYYIEQAVDFYYDDLADELKGAYIADIQDIIDNELNK